MHVIGKVLVGAVLLGAVALVSAPSAAADVVCNCAPSVVVFNNTGADSGNDSILEVDRTLNLNRGPGSAGSDSEGAFPDILH
ncbi:hypothetical protein Acsp04_39590 [Actinomadura sp. NBRC 104425]|uniref:hypothetical protein n=1 Tax=Actinomadura sp. NBRC 104425 TaxID=3032204 RepID=UPI0024A430C2|nr:hypothetical protein [Actinomadura sp. NBRC 104425]GLZ13724.1 hypothetical protein Acsp04_39590 [Actinomadura sp. NBRC 104425]